MFHHVLTMKSSNRTNLR